MKMGKELSTSLNPNPAWAKLPLFNRKNWSRLRFGDIVENVNERVEPSTAAEAIYVGLDDLDSGSLHIRRWGKGSDVIGTKLGFRKGDVIFGRRRAYQRKLAVAEVDGICSAHAMVARAKPKVILPDFLPFLMMSDKFMNRAVDISVGSLSPTINWTTLKLEEFDLPPLDQQRRIAEILWAVDETLQKWVSAFTALEALDLQMSKALLVQNGGDSVCLGDCVVLIGGQHIDAKDYSEKPQGTPYLTGPADFPDGIIKISRYTTDPKVCCEKGDVLVTCKGFLRTS